MTEYVNSLLSSFQCNNISKSAFVSSQAGIGEYIGLATFLGFTCVFSNSSEVYESIVHELKFVKAFSEK